MKIKPLIQSLLSLFYPQTCPVCNRILIDGEKFICMHCLFQIPRTHYHLASQNQAEERFRGKIPIRKASAFLYYSKGGKTQKVIAEIKYKGNFRMGEWIGEIMAGEMIRSSFFEDIDMIVPVPLHKKRERQRGYNQAEAISKGVGKGCNIPVNNTCLIRKSGNSTQTRKSIFERWLNTQGIFEVRYPEQVNGKHVLIIDDVLTTGSTIEACAASLLKCKNVKISILTLAITQ